ncbi:MAG: ornithine cyclodeaminase family protein [Acidobacteriota bacterium]|jgi:ornithine cyclodeaminase/alanine dehydrogenase-like protein (mu-crystallin family)|nr:ornithine cyclodeaminase family protein [Acidobacteriota bacterium]NLT34073.1 ornithine cyclodeaminase family protein [Acidobacteriota bacterium]
MAIFLQESDINALASMDMAIEAVERAFRLQGEEKAHIAPRRRCRLEKGMFHVMGASLPSLGFSGLKSYTSVAGVNRFVVLLYDGEGRLAAVMDADRLGQLRTGAASAVATRFMAREDASRLGVFGAGAQARAQIEAIRAVRPIEKVTVYARTADKLKAFCREMAEATGIKIVPAAGPEAAVRDQDIVATATTSSEPVFQGEWLAAGVHINAVGSNCLSRREIDVETVRRSACVIVDSLEQARLESGDLERAAEEEAFYWEDARELGLVVVGEFPGREDAGEITLFESQGVALEDVALAAEIYRRALEAGTGAKLPF